jgi:ribosomal protein S18 acetylase RimI-like enzyme
MDLETVKREAETPQVAAKGDVRRAADDLAAAFVHDPIFGWFMRDDPRRDAARQRFFRVILKDAAFSDGQIERPASGGAAAVWLRSEKLGGQPLHRELRALPMLLNATGFGRIGRLMKLRDAMDSRHPMDRPHDYLWFLGVHPNAQGGGIGSRLLRARTDRLDAAGRCGFLETGTPRNLALYQRHGFEIIYDFKPAPDGPLIRGMWREPKVA